MPVGGEQDVRRLDIAVQHTGAVSGLDGTADPDGDAQHFSHRQALSAVALAERRRAQLHDEVRPAIRGDTRLVHGEDRRVGTELGHQVRLGLEHLADLVVDDLAEHYLDGDLPPWHVLFIEEDVGETAGPENVDVRESRQDRGLGWQATRHGFPLHR